MSLGHADREVHYNASQRETFNAAVTALQLIGRLEEQGDQTSTATARVRYGLRSVRLRISVLPAAEGSIVRISGASDDVWGAGARKAADKFVRALSGPVDATLATPSSGGRIAIAVAVVAAAIVIVLGVVLLTAPDPNHDTPAAADSTTSDIGIMDEYDPATDAELAPDPTASEDVVGIPDDSVYPTDDYVDEDTSEEVTFRVGGKGRALQITVYVDGQISQVTDVKLPWKKTITVEAGESVAGYNVNAQRSSGNNGSITCSIEHDGLEVVENKSKGPYSVVACVDPGS